MMLAEVRASRRGMEQNAMKALQTFAGEVREGGGSDYEGRSFWARGVVAATRFGRDS